MEHSSISGGYTDAGVSTNFPDLENDAPRIRYLPPCGIGNDGAITPASVAAAAQGIQVVPLTDAQGVRVLRNASLSLALVAMQKTGTSPDTWANANLNFYWALRYIPSNQFTTTPGFPSRFSGGALPNVPLFGNNQFTFASGLYLANDRSISIALPDPVYLQSGDSIVLQVWYTQAFARATGFTGDLNLALNGVLNYNISYK